MIKQVIFLSLALHASLDAAAVEVVPYARFDMQHVSAQIDQVQELIDARSTKRRVIGAGTALLAVLATGWLVHCYRTGTGPFAPDEQRAGVLPAGSATDLELLRGQAFADFIQHQRELRTPMGMFKYKLQEGVVFGLAAALVGFVLSRASDALPSLKNIGDRLLPLGDVHLLTAVMHDVLANSCRYERIMADHLDMQQEPQPPLVQQVIERNKRFEHAMLVLGLERIIAWGLVFASDALRPQLQELAQQTADAVNHLATAYTSSEMTSKQVQVLLSAFHVQLEQLMGVVIAIAQEHGYQTPAAA